MRPELEAAYAHCRALLREQDRDRYFCDLFAPAAMRRHLFALHAFSSEVARVRDLVSAPMPGEIRLQWWRDAIAGEARGDIAAHPVAAALIDTIERFELPRQAFIDLIDARVFDLYDDSMPSLGDLEGYLGETSSALIRLASLVLAEGRDPGFADAAGHAGLAYGFAGLLRALPWHARQGRHLLPKDILELHGVSDGDITEGHGGGAGLDLVARDIVVEAEKHLSRARQLLLPLPKPLRPAFLPLALVPAQIARISRKAPLAPDTPVSPLAVLWRLWRTARKGF